MTRLTFDEVVLFDPFWNVIIPDITPIFFFIYKEIVTNTSVPVFAAPHTQM